MNDQARLDCFSQPDFIREQNPRRLTACNLGINVELMRNEFNSSALEAADF